MLREEVIGRSFYVSFCAFSRYCARGVMGSFAIRVVAKNWNETAQRFHLAAGGHRAPKRHHTYYACCYSERIIRLDRRQLDINEIFKIIRTIILCTYQRGEL